VRDARWLDAITAGGSSFVKKLKSETGFKAVNREVTEVTGKYTLREQSESYAVNFAHENEALRSLIPAVLCPTTLAQIKPAVDLFSRLLDRIDKPNVYKILNLRWGLVPLLGDERDRAR